MSGTITTYFGIVFEASGRLAPFGNPRTGAEYTIPGTGVFGHRPGTLAAGEMKELWKYTDMRDFEKAYIRLYSGNATLYVHADTPVSANDLNPSGLNTRVFNEDFDCNGPGIKLTDSCRIHPTLSTQNSLTNGVPTMASDAGTLQGKIYGLWLKNLSATDALTFEALVIN